MARKIPLKNRGDLTTTIFISNLSFYVSQRFIQLNPKQIKDTPVTNTSRPMGITRAIMMPEPNATIQIPQVLQLFLNFKFIMRCALPTFFPMICSVFLQYTQQEGFCYSKKEI